MKKIYSIAGWCGLILSCPLHPNQAQECPPAPRSVEYSRDFYLAQRYFMEHSNEFKASAKAVVNGVPIGGNASQTDWSTEQSSMTESEAVRYIQKELQNRGAQIVAECGSVLCEMTKGEIGFSVERVTALDTMGKICESALGLSNSSSSSSRTANEQFTLLPSNRLVFFAENQTERGQIVLALQNKTAGQLELEIEQEDLPADFLENQPVRFAREDKKIILPPNALIRLPFYVKPTNRGASELIKVPVTIRSKADSRVMSTANIVIAASPEVFQSVPELSSGKLITHAGAWANAVGKIPLRAPQQNEEYSLPYKGGPSLLNGDGGGYGQAITTAKMEQNLSSSKTRLSQSLFLRHDFGGNCSDQATGGVGWLAPEWHSNLNLPEVLSDQSWNAVIDVNSITKDAAGYKDIDSSLQGEGWLTPDPCELRVMGFDSDQSLSIPRDGKYHRLELKNLKGGLYQIHLICGGTARGCTNNIPGLSAMGYASEQINFNIKRVKLEVR